MMDWLASLKHTGAKKCMPVLSFPCVSLLGITVRELISDSDLQAKGMKAVADATDSAASVSFMDLSVEAEAFGARTVYAADEVPTIIGQLVEDEEDAKALKVPEVGAGRPDAKDIAEIRGFAGRVLTAIESGKTVIAELEAQVVVLTEEKDAITAEAEVTASELLAEIAVETAKVEQLNEQLSAANAELTAFQRELNELKAYMLSRELAEGQAHTASTLDNAIVVAADGVSATWNYSNTLVSGNAVIVTITVDGAEVFASAKLNPGETLNAFTLNAALAAGSYEGVAAATVYDAAGEYVSAARIPVTVIVG